MTDRSKVIFVYPRDVDGFGFDQLSLDVGWK